MSYSESRNFQYCFIHVLTEGTVQGLGMSLKNLLYTEIFPSAPDVDLPCSANCQKTKQQRAFTFVYGQKFYIASLWLFAISAYRYCLMGKTKTHPPIWQNLSVSSRLLHFVSLSCLVFPESHRASLSFDLSQVSISKQSGGISPFSLRKSLCTRI